MGGSTGVDSFVGGENFKQLETSKKIKGFERDFRTWNGSGADKAKVNGRKRGKL